MATAYGRVYSLQIIKQPELLERTTLVPNSLVRTTNITTSTFSPDQESGFTTYTDFNTSNFRNSITIDDLQIKAKVTYSKEAPAGTNPQNTVIQVFNMSEDNRNFPTKGNTVILKAGYLSDLTDTEVVTSIGVGTVDTDSLSFF